MDQALYRELAAIAREGRTETYGELGRVVGLSMANPQHRGVIGGLLDEIDRREHAAGRPQLAAVVVRRREGYPGRGFFVIARQLGRHTGEDDVAYWREEIRRVHTHWAASDAGAQTGAATCPRHSPR